MKFKKLLGAFVLASVMLLPAVVIATPASASTSNYDDETPSNTIIYDMNLTCDTVTVVNKDDEVLYAWRGDTTPPQLHTLQPGESATFDLPGNVTLFTENNEQFVELGYLSRDESQCQSSFSMQWYCNNAGGENTGNATLNGTANSELVTIEPWETKLYFYDSSGLLHLILSDEDGVVVDRVFTIPVQCLVVEIPVPGAPGVSDLCGPNNNHWTSDPVDTDKVDWTKNEDGSWTVRPQEDNKFLGDSQSVTYQLPADTNEVCTDDPVAFASVSGSEDCYGVVRWVGEITRDGLDGELLVSVDKGVVIIDGNTFTVAGSIETANVVVSAGDVRLDVIMGTLDGPPAGSCYVIQEPDKTTVTASASASNPCGVANDTFAHGSETGVGYEAIDQRVDGVGNVVILAAALNAGYVLTEQSDWTFEFTNEPCPEDVPMLPKTGSETTIAILAFVILLLGIGLLGSTSWSRRRQLLLN